MEASGSARGPGNQHKGRVGVGSQSKLLSESLIISNSSRYAVDPYAVLALLGFMVFLFYIIYRQVETTENHSNVEFELKTLLPPSFLNNSGNGRRSFDEDTETVMVALVKYHEQK